MERGLKTPEVDDEHDTDKIEKSETETLEKFDNLVTELKSNIRNKLNGETAENVAEKYKDVKKFIDDFSKKSTAIIEEFKSDTSDFAELNDMEIASKNLQSSRAYLQWMNDRAAELASSQPAENIVQAEKAIKLAQQALHLDPKLTETSTLSGSLKPEKTTLPSTKGSLTPARGFQRLINADKLRGRSETPQGNRKRTPETEKRPSSVSPFSKGGNGSKRKTKKRAHNFKKRWPTRSSRKPNGKGRRTRSRPRN